MSTENTPAAAIESPHIRLPKVLREGDAAAAVDVLREYFTRKVVKTGHLRSGARWDGWDPSGRRGADADVFTADDLVAITALSVEVPPEGAWILLVERRPARGGAGAADPRCAGLDAGQGVRAETRLLAAASTPVVAMCGPAAGSLGP